MTIIMSSGTFRLKGRQLFGKGFSEGKLKTIQDIATRSGMSYPTANRWVQKPDAISGVSFINLAGFLVDGLGFTPDEISNMRFGDVFDFIPAESQVTNDMAE